MLGCLVTRGVPLQTSLSPQPTKLGPEPLVFYLRAAVARDVVAGVVAAVGGGNLALGVQLPNTTAHGALHCCTDQRGLSSTGSSHHQPQQWPMAHRAVNRPSRSFTVPVLIESDYDAMITLVSIDKSRHLSEDDGVKLLKCITVPKISNVSKQ